MSLYILASEVLLGYKIGYSTMVPKRIRASATRLYGSGVQVYVMQTPDPPRHEREVHVRLTEEGLHVTNEIFRKEHNGSDLLQYYATVLVDICSQGHSRLVPLTTDACLHLHSFQEPSDLRECLLEEAVASMEDADEVAEDVAASENEKLHFRSDEVVLRHEVAGGLPCATGHAAEMSADVVGTDDQPSRPARKKMRLLKLKAPRPLPPPGPPCTVSQPGEKVFHKHLQSLKELWLQHGVPSPIGAKHTLQQWCSTMRQLYRLQFLPDAWSLAFEAAEAEVRERLSLPDFCFNWHEADGHHQRNKGKVVKANTFTHHLANLKARKARGQELIPSEQEDATLYCYCSRLQDNHRAGKLSEEERHALEDISFPFKDRNSLQEGSHRRSGWMDQLRALPRNAEGHVDVPRDDAHFADVHAWLQDLFHRKRISAALDTPELLNELKEMGLDKLRSKHDVNFQDRMAEAQRLQGQNILDEFWDYKPAQGGAKPGEVLEWVDRQRRSVSKSIEKIVVQMSCEERSRLWDDDFILTEAQIEKLIKRQSVHHTDNIKELQKAGKGQQVIVMAEQSAARAESNFRALHQAKFVFLRDTLRGFLCDLHAVKINIESWSQLDRTEKARLRSNFRNKRHKWKQEILEAEGSLWVLDTGAASLKESITHLG